MHEKIRITAQLMNLAFKIIAFVMITFLPTRPTMTIAENGQYTIKNPFPYPISVNIICDDGKALVQIKAQSSEQVQVKNGEGQIDRYCFMGDWKKLKRL